VFEVKELSEDADFCRQPLQVSARTVGAHIWVIAGSSSKSYAKRRRKDKRGFRRVRKLSLVGAGGQT